MDRWMFLVGVIVVCCILCPPFLGLWIGVGLFCGIGVVINAILNDLIP